MVYALGESFEEAFLGNGERGISGDEECGGEAIAWDSLRKLAERDEVAHPGAGNYDYVRRRIRGSVVGHLGGVSWLERNLKINHGP